MKPPRLFRDLAVASAISLFAAALPSAHAKTAATNVPAGIQASKDLGVADPSTEINITVHLKLTDKAAFDKAVDALYDPASPTFHKWMTNAELKMYAPTEAQRQAVRQELQNHGLTILSTDPHGFTIRARGSIASVEAAFNTEIHQFEHNGRTFRAQVRDARLTGEAGNYVSSVAGLESHQVRPLFARAMDPRTQKPLAPVPLSKSASSTGFPPITTTQCLSAPGTFTLQGDATLPSGVFSGTVYSAETAPDFLVCDYLPSQLQSALGLIDVYAAGLTGAGQTIVLVEAYGYPTLVQDANTFFKMAGLPLLNKSNFSIVYPQGKPNNQLGILTGWNVEMALDLQWAHSIAPGAKIVVVVTAGQDSEDFQNAISYVAANGLGNQASNSYEEDLDIIAGPLEQTSWDDTIEIASAKGISVNFSTGDNGDDGLGTPLGSAGVPSNSPHATAIGGTSILNDIKHPGLTITTGWGDTWVAFTGLEITFSPPSAVWTFFDPPLPLGLVGGGSGGGQSVFFPKPSWQKSLPGKGRQTPDVSALADPYTGVPLIITESGQQFIFLGVGGTSLASPIFTGFWALANQAAGHSLGQAAPAIAALPYGGVKDVRSTTDVTSTNATGVITDSSGTTTYTAYDLFDGLIHGKPGFTSALWIHAKPSSSYTLGFGLDTSLTVGYGWDNVTGYGTPYGLAFINAVSGTKK